MFLYVRELLGNFQKIQNLFYKHTVLPRLKPHGGISETGLRGSEISRSRIISHWGIKRIPHWDITWDAIHVHTELWLGNPWTYTRTWNEHQIHRKETKDWAHLYLNSKYQNRSLGWHDIKKIFGGRNKRNHREKDRTNKLVINKLVSTRCARE